MIVKDDFPDPLWIVDAFILGPKKVQEYADVPDDVSFEDFVGALTEFVFDDAQADPISALFDERLAKDDQLFIAASFLRLVGHKQRSLSKSVKIEAFKLFDRAYGTSLYDLEDLSVEDQNFIKQNSLESMPGQVEQQLESAINAMSSLRGVEAHREQFFKALNSTIGKAIVAPFLPNDLIIPSRLQELFKSALAVTEAALPDVVDTYDDATETIQIYKAEANRQAGWYTRVILERICDQLLAAMEYTFGNMDAAKPASLSALPDEKRYPLHEADLETDLRLNVMNSGPGTALDIRIDVEDAEGVEPLSGSLGLGQLSPAGRGERLVQIPVRIGENDGDLSEAELLLEISWSNADGTRNSVGDVYCFGAQSSSINWERYKWENPYDLEPVEGEHELVGRQRALGKLFAMVRAQTVGNSIIYGQRRVGKTSIAKTLLNRLQQAHDLDTIGVYLDAGQFVASSAEETVHHLGVRIAKRIQLQRPELSDLYIPECRGTLAPLNDFLSAIARQLPGVRIVLVLDEFDDIPISLYRRGELANAFFLSLRSISGSSHVGFILVGGQNIDHILSCQGQALNKFSSIEVTYFDRTHQWDDFADLVRQPARGILEFSDSALESLFDETSGHPFFTKWICQTVFSRAVERRDAHVTNREVGAAINESLESVGTQQFQHFWEDGIFEEGAKREEISILRRNILLGLSRAISYDQQAADLQEIREGMGNHDVSKSDIGRELDEFVSRRVLSEKDGHYSTRLPFFGRWLRDSGPTDIVTTFRDQVGITKAREEEERLRVRANELQRLTERWSIYRGREITPDDVRAWLEQFENVREKRLMYELLRGVEFFSAARIRESFRNAYSMAIRSATSDLGGEIEGREFLVSFLGPFGKSGAFYARLFADENRIYNAKVVERTELISRMGSAQSPRVVIFVDDFVGTGDQARDFFGNLDREFGDHFRRDGGRGYLLVIAGVQGSIKGVVSFLRDRNMNISVHACNPLGPEDKAFSESRSLFSSKNDRLHAKAIAENYGRELVSDAPLGYGDCELLVVFDQKCPNNSLPILWSDNGGWKPLFPRH